MHRLRGRSVSRGILLANLLLVCVHASFAAGVHRVELESGVFALAKDGRNLGLELRLSSSGDVRLTLSKFLALESEWLAYRKLSNVFIPLDHLKAEHQRTVLLALFSEDVVDNRGWAHRAAMDGETLWSLCAWLTGNGNNYEAVLKHPDNAGVETLLRTGDRVFIPSTLLTAVMKRPTPVSFAEAAPELVELVEGLRYGSDRNGEYATYTLKKGESLYSSVVARFTDIRENDAIHEACRLVAKRSGIPDMRDIDAGKAIHIPLAILSDRYLPKGNPDRDRYEETIQEAKRLRGNQGRSTDLSDVVVILDPGHGGDDTGAKDTRSGLYEDEINYDIVLRIQARLRAETGAKVYMTMVDRSSAYRISDNKRFSHDRDEELLTTPHHPNSDGSSVSANLRWMLANSIYEKELKNGVDPRKVVFASIHTDSLYNEKLRGAMIYIPGAQYRRAEEVRRDRVYAKYEEGRSNNRFASSSAERTRDEAMSRNFATTLLDELGNKRVKRHDNGDPIRSKIRRDKNTVFVPAVLRNTKVPTKVLVETANLKNSTDRARLADPWWRQQFADAFVDALKRYYGLDTSTRVAQTD